MNINRPIRFVDVHEARKEAISMYPLPCAMERKAWAEDWIKSNAREIALAIYPDFDEDKQTMRNIRHRIGIFVQSAWEEECVKKWAHETNAIFDRHRGKWVIVCPAEPSAEERN